MKKRYIVLPIIFLGLWIYVQSKSEIQGGSTFSTHPSGLRALLLVLQENNVDAQTWQYPVNKLASDENKDVLFVINPKQRVNLATLSEWVKNGNTLVVSGSQAQLFLIPKRVSKDEEASEEGSKTNRALDIMNATLGEIGAVSIESDHPALQGVHSISRPKTPFTTEATGFEVIAQKGKVAFVLRKDIGAGEMWLFSDLTPMSNEYIDQNDNLRMMYQIASAGNKVYFDEFHHGFVAPVKSELQARQDSMIALIVFLALALTLAAFSRAIRFGPPRLISDTMQAKTSEFASVLGLLYRERSISEVLKYYREAWRTRLENQYGLSRNIEDQRLVDLMCEKGIVEVSKASEVNDSLYYLSQESRVKNQKLEQSVSILEELLRNHEQPRRKLS